MAVVPAWRVIVELVILGWVALFVGLPLGYYRVFIILSAGFIISPVFQIAKEWEKGVVLRLGKFKWLKGPGIFMILPLLDSVIQFVDTRIKATDFRAETTLTKDTVPTNVDAIAFWMVWDAKRAVVEVENYTEAVILSSQAALRDAIGRHDLTELLSDRERLGSEIQAALDKKTNPWGITILSIEISDIIIPKELEDAMSKQAQAERERRSRVILGTAEVEIAEKFEKASEKYKDNPTALHLRAMNMIFEGLKKQGSIILLPSSAVESMSLGTVLGSEALRRTGGLGTAGGKESGADSGKASPA
ncbi:MAG: slipin family protein [Spirochaetes bacterium]|nr:MAG: slipin family protein [Spirochaetota bacterium]